MLLINALISSTNKITSQLVWFFLHLSGLPGRVSSFSLKTDEREKKKLVSVLFHIEYNANLFIIGIQIAVAQMHIDWMPNACEIMCSESDFIGTQYNQIKLTMFQGMNKRTQFKLLLFIIISIITGCVITIVGLANVHSLERLNFCVN